MGHTGSTRLGEWTIAMFDRAIVGIDHSPTTGRMLDELGRIQRLGVTRVTLVTVLGGPYPQAPEVRHRDHYLARLQELAEELPGLDTAVEVRSGHPATELQHAAAAAGADLVIAGSHGHTPWRDLFLGSTVLDLARTCPVPILLLPLGAPRPDRGGGVLLATDGSERAAAAESLARSLGRDLGGTAVTVLSASRHVASDEREAREHLEPFADASLTPVVEHGPLPETIGRLAEAQAADVIIVGTRGRNALSGLLLGSTAEHLLRTASRPVLLVPAER